MARSRKKSQAAKTDAKPQNPFRYEFIEDEPEVINRVADRERLREVLSRPGGRLLVHGRRRMGKTTLCKAVVAEVAREGVRALMVDFSTASQPADLSNALLAGITRSMGRSWQEYLGDLLKSLTLQLETEVDPQSGALKVRLKPAARSAPVDEQRQTFLGILNHANAMARREKAHFALVIDEFQDIARFEDEATLWNLRAEVQHHANMSYVFTGSRAHLIDLLLASDRAFYKMFGALHFEPVPEPEMRAWLAERFAAGGVESAEALDELLRRAGTCTVDRLRLAANCYPTAAACGELTGPMVDRAFRTVVAEDRAFFHSDWRQLTAHQQNVMRALAEGETKLGSEAVRRHYNLPASGSVANTLKALGERGLLYDRESAPGYAYDNPFFQYWVRERNREDLGL